VFAVHGVGGIFGALATGVFATRAINPLGQGAIDGKPEQIWIQFVAVAFTVVFAGVATFIIAKGIDVFMGLRVSSADEDMGIDLSQHGEAAYQI
jgi:Amt family ammonium transporter